MLSKIDTFMARGVADSDCAAAQIGQLAVLLRSKIEKSRNQGLNNR
ncbi:hypothetical protein [Microcoleus sp. LEGE 07076]|nr:hypothetical protein [Microcoleus sp. LEGE 07076]